MADLRLPSIGVTELQLEAGSPSLNSVPLASRCSWPPACLFLVLDAALGSDLKGISMFFPKHNAAMSQAVPSSVVWWGGCAARHAPSYPEVPSEALGKPNKGN